MELISTFMSPPDQITAFLNCCIVKNLWTYLNSTVHVLALYLFSASVCVIKVTL